MTDTASDTFKINDQVQVHHFGRWYLGRITAVHRTMVTVRFFLHSGRPVERRINAVPSMVRPTPGNFAP